MAFSFFTKRLARPSRRLRFLARSFQLFAGAQLVRAIAIIVFVPTLRDKLSPESMTGLLVSTSAFGTLQALSLFMIGRALLRRQKWGGYVGAFVIVAPLVVRPILGQPISVFGIGTVLSLVSVAVLGSAWKELDSNAEEEPDDSDSDEPVLTPRNRGYGESRTLPHESVPVAAVVAPTTPLAVKNLRND
jgi:hypothetical protein